MTKPFFSVVIPTRNRHFLVGTAIQSVLRQSFADFEVVIADNDDTNETRKVIETFTDSRIHYFRSGGLSMPDNWEFAIRQAQGEYITILEDKEVLRKHALEKVFGLVEAERYPVVSWLYDRFYDTHKPPTIIKTEGTGANEAISSSRIIEMFINNGRSGECDRLLPRGLNSCIHCSMVERIRNGPVHRLCAYMAPDYTMGFQLLAYCSVIMHIDESLAVVGGYRYSTGRTSKENRNSAFKYYQESNWDEFICYNRVPVKVFTISGALYNDYDNIRFLVGGNLAAYPLNLPQYFIQCFNDLQVSKNKGTRVWDEETEWMRALSEQDPSTQTAVYKRLLTDQIALNSDLSKQLSELAASRDQWKADFREIEKGLTILDRFVLSRWSRSVLKLLRINRLFELRRGNSYSAQNSDLDFSNALEYVIWEDSNHLE